MEEKYTVYEVWGKDGIEDEEWTHYSGSMNEENGINCLNNLYEAFPQGMFVLIEVEKYWT